MYPASAQCEDFELKNQITVERNQDKEVGLIMPELTEEMLQEAVKNCKWRQNFCGTDICSGNCNICSREIEAGRCDTLTRLVAEYKAKEAVKMDECISRNKAINAIKSLESSMLAKDNYAKGYDAALGRALIAVREVPSIANVQPVVRCKDCKHRKEHHYEESDEKPYIKYECKFTKYSMSDDGFCSFGARMDGDSE